MFFMSLGAFSY